MTQPTSYDPLVPEKPTESLAQTQPELLNNFQQLYNVFSVNHIPLDTMITAGNHMIVELFQRDSAPQTNVSQLSVYSKDVEGQTDQTFIRMQGNGQEIQFTNYQVYSIDNSQNQEYYFTFLPGKILLYFGKRISLSGNNPASFKLRPTIAKNIISACVVPEFNNVSRPKDYPSKPDIKLIKNTDGIISSIQILYPQVQIRSRNSFYFVMANI